MDITNRNNKKNSLQISRMGNIPLLGEFKPTDHFLIKGLSTDEDGFPINTNVRIIPEGQEDWIETVIYPGWNPELCKAVEILDSTGADGDSDSASASIKLLYGW